MAAALSEKTRRSRRSSWSTAIRASRGPARTGNSCIYTNTISWRTDTQALPAENNPGVVFERMFGDGGTAAQRRVQMRNNESILDSVTGELALSAALGPGDRATVNEYTEAVRDVEQRIQRAERTVETTAPPDRPFGIPLTFQEHLTLMFDLQILAYRPTSRGSCRS